MFKISLALTNMAADIAVLAGGSAPVGVAFKGAAAATDASAGFSVGSSSGVETSRSRKHHGEIFGFDANKSTAKKFAMYNGYVDKLYAMVLKANKMPVTDDTTRAAAIAAGENVYAYVKAMGMSRAEVDSLCTKPLEMRKKLIEKMKERD